LANESRKESVVIKEETAVKTWTVISNYLANYCQQFTVLMWWGFFQIDLCFCKETHSLCKLCVVKESVFSPTEPTFQMLSEMVSTLTLPLGVLKSVTGQ